MTREFRTEVYLLIGDELRVVRSEGGVEEQPVDGPVEYTPINSPRGGSAMGGVHFFVPTESRPGSNSPLAEARNTSPVATMVRALSMPTRLPMVVAAEVHRPMGGAVFNFAGGGGLLVLLGDRRRVLTDASLGDILTEPYVDSYHPVPMMGVGIDFVRKGEGPWDGGGILEG